ALVVRTVVPVAVSACAIESNGGDGIDVQRSQPASLSGVAQLTVDGCRVAANGGRGVALSGLGAGPGALAGGKVGVHLTKNTIKGNANVGVFVSEASDAIDGEDVTELWAEDNDVSGNLTTSVPSTVMAGGFFFASSDSTTRVMLRSFLGNQVHGNGRAEIGFELVQDDAQPWNLSARAVDPSALCSDSADSNAVYCYDTYPGDYAIAVSSTSVHLEVKGMHFQDTTALGGRDFTAGIPPSEITAFCPPRACP
ncbi:MAG TPA: right-handed parallel beta-helix repeat-containing protein, partial [Polyangia bacterium]